MKSKNLLFSFFLILFSASILAQTKVIAFRSHSGNMKFFSSAEPDNLGMVMEIEIDTVIRISDTSIVEITRYNNYNRRVDTIYDRVYADTSINAEEWKSYYPFNTVLIGFDSTQIKTPFVDTLVKPKEHIKRKNEKKKNGLFPFDSINNNQPKDNLPTSPLNYFLFGLTGVMLFTGTFIWLVNRKKILPA